jgi:hypothetical protein
VQFHVGSGKAEFMAKMVKKSDLPSKICAVCERPFDWRRKWAKVWGDVKCCSDRCRRDAKNKVG